MKILWLLLSLLVLNHLYSQKYNYIFTYDIQSEEFSPNDSFFLSISDAELEKIENMDTLLILINQINKRIYFSEEGLFSNQRSDQLIDSIREFISLIKYDPKFEKKVIYNDDFLIIKIITLNQPLNSTQHSASLKESIPLFYYRGKRIKKMYKRIESLIFLDGSISD